MNASFLELVRSWLSTGALLGLLGLGARFSLALRKQKLVEKQDDREGFAELIAALQADVSFVRAQLEQARLDHQTCQHEMALVRRETEVLRQQVAILSQRAIPALDGPVPASVPHEG